MTEHEPLPEELAELFAAERTAPVANPAIREALRAKLGASAVTLTAGKVAAASLLGPVGKTLAVLALTIGAGTGAVAIMSTDEPHVVARAEQPAHGERAEPPRIEPAPMVPPVESPQPIAEPPPEVPAPVAPRHARTMTMTPAAAPQPPSTSQAQLLKTAWASLSSGAAERALELARDDEVAHPTGELSEERDALVVEALAKLARADEARAALAAFVTRYPDSIHRARVERATQELP